MLGAGAVNSGGESVFPRTFPQPVQALIPIKSLIWIWFFQKINIWASSAPLHGAIGRFGQEGDYGLSPIPTDSKNQKEEKIHFQDF
jgi:hypothetical protein